MAKKTRKQKQRAAARRTVAVRSPSSPLTLPREPFGLPSGSDEVDAALTSSDEAAVDVVDAPAQVGARRRIERLSQAAAPVSRAGRPGRGPANAAAMFQPLETEDAAIPFDRVPYVPADLRRVAITAGLMIVLILIAAVVVTHVVQ
jgi:hypothetical protein